MKPTATHDTLPLPGHRTLKQVSRDEDQIARLNRVPNSAEYRALVIRLRAIPSGLANYGAPIVEPPPDAA